MLKWLRSLFSASSSVSGSQGPGSNKRQAEPPLQSAAQGSASSSASRPIQINSENDSGTAGKRAQELEAKNEGRDSIEPGSRPLAEAARYYIGLDYGTHSTKVVVSHEEEDRGFVLLLDDPPDNEVIHDPRSDAPYPWFAVPSVVGIVGDRLVFGEAARTAHPSARHYALKTTILKGVPEVPDVTIRQLGCSSASEACDLLVAGYLAWVLGRVRDRMDQRFGVGRWRPFVCLSAPMDRYEDEALKTRYERVLSGAYRLAFESGHSAELIEQALRMQVESLRDALSHPVPSESERMFSVLPETVAGLVPLSVDPRWSSGYYNVIDIGGGTTEVSINWVATDPEPKIDCRRDRSIPIGAIAARSFDPATGHGDPRLGISRAFNETWVDAYSLDKGDQKLRSLWVKCTVLQAGGGWSVDGVDEIVRRRHPANSYFGPEGGNHPLFGLEFELYVPSPEVLEMPEVEGGTPDRNEARFLAVALGLSLYLQWPEWFRPSQAGAPIRTDVSPPDPDATHGHS